VAWGVTTHEKKQAGQTTSGCMQPFVSTFNRRVVPAGMSTMPTASPLFGSILVKMARDPSLMSPTDVMFVTSFVAPTYKSLVSCGLPCGVTVDPNTTMFPLTFVAGGKKLMTGPGKIGSCCPNAGSEVSDRSAAMKAFMHSSGRGNLIVTLANPSLLSRLCSATMNPCSACV